MLTEHNEYSLETIFSICHDLRKNGKTIAFTHGAFDLFHYGHLHLLRRTSECADFTIVGVEQDRNIQSYKDPSRPIIPEEKRLEIINEIKCVNLAFILREEPSDQTYEDLYKELGISLISYGGSHAYSNRVRERALMLGILNLEIMELPMQSTTSIINQIRNND